MTNDRMMNNELPEGWANVPIKELVELNPKANHADDLEVGFVPMPLMGTRFGEAARYEARRWGDVKKGPRGQPQNRPSLSGAFRPPAARYSERMGTLQNVRAAIPLRPVTSLS